jgi:iron complex outermembrane recepter protein
MQYIFNSACASEGEVTIRKPAPLLVAILLVLGGAQVADAQGTEAGKESEDRSAGVTLEMITVTSSRREVDLQAVPMVVTAISGERLQELRIRTVDQYALFIPGMNFNRTTLGDREGLDIQIRGVSNTRLADLSGGVGSNTTGFYLDEIAVIPVDPMLYDLQRIEVLRGPQGTYFGQASMGGTVRMITNQPNAAAFEAAAEAKFAGTDDGEPSWSLKGMLNMPLIDNVLALRVVGYHELEGGFIDWRQPSLLPGGAGNDPNNFPPFVDEWLNDLDVVEDANDKTITGGRVALRFTPTDRLSITAAYMQQEKDNDFSQAIDSNLGGGLVQARYVPDPRGEEFDLASLTIVYDFQKFTLLSATGYFERDLRNTVDQTFLNATTRGRTAAGGLTTLAWIDFSFKNDILSQELRLTSREPLRIGSVAVDWIVGGSYLDEEREIVQVGRAPNHNANVARPPGQFVPGGLLNTDGLTTAATFLGGYEAKSAFGELTFKFLDERLHLGLGGRYFDQRWELGGFSANLNSPGAINTREFREGDETGFSPRIVASYFLSDDRMFYTSASNGFRVGGPGPSVTEDRPECLAALALFGIEPGSSFESDELWNYELGFKGRFANGKVQVNSSIYHIDWSDLQTNVLLGAFSTCPGTAATNLGDATIDGVDFDVNAAATDNLSLRFAASYTKTELGELPPGLELLGEKGDPLQNVPEWQVVAGLEYQLPATLGGRFSSFVRVDASYTDETFTRLGQKDNPNVHVPEKTVVNMMLGIRPSADSWSAELFIDNVFNEDIVFGRAPRFGEPFSIQTLVGRPRSYGIVMRKSW